MAHMKGWPRLLIGRVSRVHQYQCTKALRYVKRGLSGRQLENAVKRMIGEIAGLERP